MVKKVSIAVFLLACVVVAILLMTRPDSDETPSESPESAATAKRLAQLNAVLDEWKKDRSDISGIIELTGKEDFPEIAAIAVKEGLMDDIFMAFEQAGRFLTLKGCIQICLNSGVDITDAVTNRQRAISTRNNQEISFTEGMYLYSMINNFSGDDQLIYALNRLSGKTVNKLDIAYLDDIYTCVLGYISSKEKKETVFNDWLMAHTENNHFKKAQAVYSNMKAEEITCSAESLYQLGHLAFRRKKPAKGLTYFAELKKEYPGSSYTKKAEFIAKRRGNL